MEFYQFKKVFLKLLVPNWDDPEGWDGEGGGGGFSIGTTCKPMADSYQCMAKTTTTIL